MATIRRIDADERLSAIFPLLAYSFDTSPSAPPSKEEVDRTLRYHEGNHTLVVEDGDTVLATASAIPMWQNLRGVVMGMAGIAWVATHPLARRRGHSRDLMHRLHADMRDMGHPVATLYPFRASFYERLGYLGLPMPRTVTFAPADLDSLRRVPLPGEVDCQAIRDGFDTYREFTRKLLAQRHGFTVTPDYRAVRVRDAADRWLATARIDGQLVGAVTYRIEDHGGVLRTDELLTTDPLGRALLLQFFAQHVDQVTEIAITVAADETPELWATDLAARIEARIAFPESPALMGRLLAIDALRGLAAGPGQVRVEVVDDPFLAGRYVLESTDGRLDVTTDEGAAPPATLTSAGLAGLAYGVFDPLDAVARGLGTMTPDAATALRSIFPRCTPHAFGRG